VWRRIFDGSGGTTNAVWSPDGQSVIGSSDHYGGRFSNLYEISAAGANERRITHNEHYGQYAQSWSAKAGAVAFAEGVHADTGVDIWVMPLQGDGKAAPFLNSADSEMNPAFSPDGKWLAYTRSGPSGVTVRIRAYPAGGPGISLEPGSAGPVWSHDGREIYYRLGRAMKAAGFANGRAGEARKLFEGSYAGPETWNVNAVLTRDGKFVLMKYAEQNPADRRLNVVVNWFTELKRVGQTN
jgi:Tol biopolymer transport system component